MPPSSPWQRRCFRLQLKSLLWANFSFCSRYSRRTLGSVGELVNRSLAEFSACLAGSYYPPSQHIVRQFLSFVLQKSRGEFRFQMMHTFEELFWVLSSCFASFEWHKNNISSVFFSMKTAESLLLSCISCFLLLFPLRVLHIIQMLEADILMFNG